MRRRTVELFAEFFPQPLRAVPLPARCRDGCGRPRRGRGSGCTQARCGCQDRWRPSNGATAPYQSSRRLCLPSNVDVQRGQEGALPTWDARIPAKVRTQCGPELAHVEYRVETPALPQRWVGDERLNTGGSWPGRSTEPGDLRARPRRKTALGSPSCRESAAHARAPSALTRHRPPACRAPERPGEPTGHTDLSRPST